MKIRFNIDEKSLYRGIVNDYSKGQTATVHTPLNQAKNPDKWRKDIYSFIEQYPSMVVSSLPSVLVDKCTSKTTSQAETEIVQFYCFNHFLLDGKPFSSDASFAMYVKQEIDEHIVDREGVQQENTHLGRQKLHYPLALKHYSDDFSIDNAKILDAIMEINGGFAYVVDQFEIDTEKHSLNFITTMVGLKGEVLLSNVFRRQKGKGRKLLLNGVVNSLGFLDTMVKSNQILTNEENDKFFDSLHKIEEACRTSGKLGEEYVFDNLEKIVGYKVEKPFHVSKKHPQSLYDIEYELDGVKKYIEVKSTTGNEKKFIMSKGERKFMTKYEADYLLVLVLNVKSNRKTHYSFTKEQIMSSSMKQEYQDIMFYVVK